MKRTPVISYIRVSTPSQAKNGVSSLDQQNQHEEFASAHELIIAQSFSDVGSALNEEDVIKRDEFRLARSLALKNDWPVLVSTPSRFTRTLVVFDRFVEKGGRLLCVNLGMGATEGEIRNYLMVEITEHEQRQRTAAIGRKRAVEEGKLAGHTLPAWGRESSVKTRKEKALRGYEEFERQLVDAQAAGATTVREIAMAFRKSGFKTPGKQPWKPNNVRRVLQTIEELKAGGGFPSAFETAQAGVEEEGKFETSIACCDGGVSPALRLSDNLRPIVEIKTKLTAAGALGYRPQPLGGNDNAGCEFSVDENPPILPSDVGGQGAGYLTAANENEPEPETTVQVAQLEAAAGEEFALSAETLAEFRDLVIAHHPDPDKRERLIAIASSPALSKSGRATILTWMAQKRAA